MHELRQANKILRSDKQKIMRSDKQKIMRSDKQTTMRSDKQEKTMRSDKQQIYIYIYIHIYIADWPIDPNLGLPAESRSTKQWCLRWSAKTPKAKLAKLGNLWQSLSSARR